MFRRFLSLFACLLLFPMAGMAQDAPATATDLAEEAHIAPAYVLLTLQSGSYWLALPDEGEVDIPIRQTRDDGSEEINTLRLTPKGVYMLSATCENQDCVEQGMVSIENRTDRILGNMILCLPNAVAVELFTPEEIRAMYASREAQP